MQITKLGLGVFYSLLNRVHTNYAFHVARVKPKLMSV